MTAVHAVLLAIALLGFTTASLLAWRHVALHRAAALLAAQIDAPQDAKARGLADRLRAATLALAARDAEAAVRATQRHAVTGLPTREPLLARMAEDGAGLLAVLAFKDFDRLSAFDPQMGERVLVALVDRLRTMLSPSRGLAHVDRGHLAIWFAGGAIDADADRQIDALAYALSDRIVDGDREILPEIAVRKTMFDPAATTPAATLARTISAFALACAADVTDVVQASQQFERERFLLEQDLRQAVGRGEFRLQFQPLVDAGRSRICGAEALIRWQHPTRGLVPPSRFVPVMEAAGLASEIGSWTLNAAVREARAWRTAGLRDLRVAVNVSAHQLDEQNLDALVGRVLATHGVDSGALEIELTESVAMGDGNRAARLSEALRRLGVTIAIDDFGTGFSSFSTLRTLGFDKIKIDREFVTNVHLRKDSQAICHAVIALGRGLGVRILAEGVESRAEYQWLRQAGCRHFQGFYFAPPLWPDAFRAFVEAPDKLAQLLAPPVSAPERLVA